MKVDILRCFPLQSFIVVLRRECGVPQHMELQLRKMLRQRDEHVLPFFR